MNVNSSHSGNDHALHKRSPRVASRRCVLVGAASTAATAGAIFFELLRCTEEAATQLQDPMLLEASFVSAKLLLGHSPT